MQSLGLILEVSLFYFFAYLLVVLLPSIDFLLYTILKTGYNKMRREIFKILMNATNTNDPTSIIRYMILFAYISLPIFIIFVSTALSVEYVFNRGFPSPVFGFIITFLFLYAILTLAHFTIMKYGAIYILPFLSLVRNDIGQLLEKYNEKYSYIQMTLVVGSLLYFVTIIALLLDLENAYTSLSKGIIFMDLAVLLIEVIRNREYNNTLKLIERTLTSSRPGGHGFSSP